MRASRSTEAPKRHSPTSRATPPAPRRPSCSATKRTGPSLPSKIVSVRYDRTAVSCTASAAGTGLPACANGSSAPAAAYTPAPPRRLVRGAPGARVIRVVIADDQTAIREGLAMLVGLIDDIEVVGTAGNGAAAVQLACDLRPDVVLMDLRMPEMEGAEATREIRGAYPDTHVLVLTTYADDESLFPAL